MQCNIRSAIGTRYYTNLTPAAPDAKCGKVDRVRLLLIEDDEALAAAVAEALRARAIACDHAASAHDAEAMLGATQYDALLLDLGLPDADGVALLRRLRTRRQSVPILIVTARGATADRVAGLEAGADDYLVKPFDVDELVARLRAVLRRPGEMRPSGVEIGNLHYDADAHTLTVAGQAVPLSAREAEIAGLLLRRAGRVVTKQLAEDQLFGASDTLGSNAVEVYVHRLRRKIERAGATVRIETIRGVGYLLRAAG